MSNAARQTMALIGIALIAAAGVLFYVSLKQPGVYESKADASQTEVTVGEKSAETEAEKETSAAKSKTDGGVTEKAVATSTQKEVSYPINLNKATAEELMNIEGLGEARACAIIEYRDYLGRYTSVEQIMQIKGIDEEIFKKVAGYLTV